MAPAPRALLIDIDGTLVDSRQVVEDAWRDAGQRFDVDTSALLELCHGRRDEDLVAQFFPRGVRHEVLRRIASFELANAACVSPMPDAGLFLSRLADGAWAAVTSGSRALMTARLRSAGLPVPRVLVAAEDTRQGKPDPEGFLTGAKRLGVPADRCAVIEDSPAGVTAGLAAGAFVIGVATTHERPALAAADAVVDTLLGAQEVLEQAGYREE